MTSPDGTRPRGDRACVLHILSQRPRLTGSGVTLEALTSRAAGRGWRQAAVIGIPVDADPRVAGVEDDAVVPVRFETDELPFRVPGMSDTMPYPSSRFSSLSAEALDRYRHAVRRTIASAVEHHRPDVIHAHHLWLASSAARDVAPGVPIAVHGHGTGLRQLQLCPHLADEVIAGVRRCDRVFALHSAHAAAIADRFAIPPDRIVTVGAGYRADLFTAIGRRASGVRIGYAGKLARAKGVPWLIEAFERIATERPDASLHLAGGGDNDDASSIRDLARRSPAAGAIELCGQLDQHALARLLRTIDVFVLPSLYEGLPLVLVEAFAAGCRVVATDLPGSRELALRLDGRVRLVATPRRVGADEPVAEDLPAFTAAIAAAVGEALDAGPAGPPPEASLRSLSWDAVFERVEHVWRSLARPVP